MDTHLQTRNLYERNRGAQWKQDTIVNHRDPVKDNEDHHEGVEEPIPVHQPKQTHGDHAQRGQGNSQLGVKEREHKRKSGPQTTTATTPKDERRPDHHQPDHRPQKAES